jgi:hypothetical protein
LGKQVITGGCRIVLRSVRLLPSWRDEKYPAVPFTVPLTLQSLALPDTAYLVNVSPTQNAPPWNFF